jgi:hypothetical protein
LRCQWQVQWSWLHQKLNTAHWSTPAGCAEVIFLLCAGRVGCYQQLIPTCVGERAGCGSPAAGRSLLTVPLGPSPCGPRREAAPPLAGVACKCRTQQVTHRLIMHEENAVIVCLVSGHLHTGHAAWQAPRHADYLGHSSSIHVYMFRNRTSYTCCPTHWRGRLCHREAAKGNWRLKRGASCTPGSFLSLVCPQGWGCIITPAKSKTQMDNGR